jgi:hypothetical protein
MREQNGGGGLALGSRNANQMHAVRRIAVKPAGKLSKRLFGVLAEHNAGIGRQIGRLFRHEKAAPIPIGVGGKAVSVMARTSDAYENRAFIGK